MTHIVDPIHELRTQIRQAMRQYRFDNDNSRSLFHPAKGFIDAYDVEKVEAALDRFERRMHTNLQVANT